MLAEEANASRYKQALPAIHFPRLFKSIKTHSTIRRQDSAVPLSADADMISIARVCQWISSYLQQLWEPHRPDPLDEKSSGDGITVFKATSSAHDADFSSVLRISDATPRRFVLCIERYVMRRGGRLPAEHCEVQFTGIIGDGEDLTLRCAHVSISNALHDTNADSKKVFSYTHELKARQTWDGDIILDISPFHRHPASPPWMATEGLPLVLSR